MNLTATLCNAFNFTKLNPKREFSRLKPFLLVTDIGFIVYWTITAAHLIPPSWAFKDYTNPILVAWNWSFFPLDMLISLTGLTSLWLFQRTRVGWRELALVSMALTVTAGLNAVAFWTIRGDFDVSWWLPNLYLVLYPLYFIPRFIQTHGN